MMLLMMKETKIFQRLFDVVFVESVTNKRFREVRLQMYRVDQRSLQVLFEDVDQLN